MGDLTARRYDATVADIVLGRVNDKDQVAIQFHIPEEDATIWAYQFLTDAALPMTEKALKAMGWDPIQNGWGVAALAREKPVIGNPVSIVLEWDEYNDERRLRVKWINAPGSGGVKDEIPDQELDSFEQAFHQRLRASGVQIPQQQQPQQATQRRPSPQNANAGGGYEDDLDF